MQDKSSRSRHGMPDSSWSAKTLGQFTKLKPFARVIVIIVALALISAGVLVGWFFSRGVFGAKPITAADTTPDASMIPLRSSGTIPKGRLLYSAPIPGRICDAGGGVWANYNRPKVDCQANSTKITNTSEENLSLAGELLTRIPNAQYPSNYVIEARIQQDTASHADFGIYFRNQLGDQQGVYTFIIHPSGSWSSYVYDNVTGAPKEIAHGTYGNAYANVLLDVVADGRNFTFYANGLRVGSVSDKTYRTGTTGIVVDAGGIIFVSNFALYTLAA